MSLELYVRIGSETSIQFGALRKNRLGSENTVRSPPKESARKREGSIIGCLDSRWGNRENIWSGARGCATQRAQLSALQRN